MIPDPFLVPVVDHHHHHPIRTTGVSSIKSLNLLDRLLRILHRTLVVTFNNLDDAMHRRNEGHWQRGL